MGSAGIIVDTVLSINNNILYIVNVSTVKSDKSTFLHLFNQTMNLKPGTGFLGREEGVPSYSIHL